MPEGATIRVLERNRRWEVRANGFARPLVDWFCTKERAIEHAIERAREIDASIVVVEGPAFTIERILYARDDLLAR